MNLGTEGLEYVAGCGCASCIEVAKRTARDAYGDTIGYLSRCMVLCPGCGNKRCPKATHHGYGCTGSNDRGQTGSWYA